MYNARDEPYNKGSFFFRENYTQYYEKTHNLKGDNNMQKVYVVTKAEIMAPELYVTVKATKKEAEKFIRADYPNARKDSMHPGLESFYCKDRSGHGSLMFIHEETI